MHGWMYVIGGFIGALAAALAFLAWAVFKVGDNAEPLDDWERRLRGDG
jgi:hypothetical protein